MILVKEQNTQMLYNITVHTNKHQQKINTQVTFYAWMHDLENDKNVIGTLCS